ncbi:MAG: bifunctional nuclease family protein [Candidatus Omnitrophota bacterium]|nr:bifunctional nuclease family protein [Candidatus Omnitrophota bacterium]
MIEVELVRIIIDENKKEQVIVLKEKKGRRLLPIVIGSNEASAIRAHLNGAIPPRPLTHDLIYSLIRVLEGTLEKIVIDKLVETTFHAKVHLRLKNGQTKIVDARPSDSVALAVRAKSPIFLEEQVLDTLAHQA